MKRPSILLDGITLDCLPEDLEAMVNFYAKLTGYHAPPLEPGVMPGVFGPHMGINFQPAEDYQRPTFPTEERGQMMHIEFYVEDLEEAKAYALSIGAVESPAQFSDSWHVLLDPAGHPFCLTLNGPSAWPEEV